MNDALETPPLPVQAAPLESAMNTGTDDEPALTVGDKHPADVPDPNGDGVLTVAEAETLLGGDLPSPPQEPTTRTKG